MDSEKQCLCSAVASMKAPWADADCFIAVTGASRGFGRALCLQLLKKFTTESEAASSIFMLLVARNMDGLLETKKLLEEEKSTIKTSTSLTVAISDPPLDMSYANEDELSRTLEPLFKAYFACSRPRYVALVNNAGFLGDITVRADQQLSLETLHKYFHGNLFAPIVLTSLFLQQIAPVQPENKSCVKSPTDTSIVIVNIGSLAADKALGHMSYYCTGKAARQMYYQCLSVDRPTVAVLNYSPGPLATDMYTELAERLGNPMGKAMCQENIKHGRVLQPEESARVCVDWLRRMKTSPDEESPTAMVCPVHENKFLELWLGKRLDYFDASGIARP